MLLHLSIEGEDGGFVFVFAVFVFVFAMLLHQMINKDEDGGIEKYVMMVMKVRMVMRSRMITIFTSQSHKREQSQVRGSPSNLISFKEDGRREAGREVQPRWEKSNTWWRDQSLMKPSLRER